MRFLILDLQIKQVLEFKINFLLVHWFLYNATKTLGPQKQTIQNYDLWLQVFGHVNIVWIIVRVNRFHPESATLGWIMHIIFSCAY